MNEEKYNVLSKVDKDEWIAELKLQDELIDKLQMRLPKEFTTIRKTLQERFESRGAPSKGPTLTGSAATEAAL